jgi:hypothetical protein
MNITPSLHYEKSNEDKEGEERIYILQTNKEYLQITAYTAMT